MVRHSFVMPRNSQGSFCVDDMGSEGKLTEPDYTDCGEFTLPFNTLQSGDPSIESSNFKYSRVQSWK